MSEVTSALSFHGMILRIAREAGFAHYGSDGQGQAAVPIDRHDLADSIEIVNDAIRKFVSNGPRNGWKWQSRIMQLDIKSTRVTGTVDSASTTTIVDATLATASGIVDSASATTIVDATLSSTYDADDDLNGKYCYILTGTGAGSYAAITDYTAATGTITVADWLTSRGLPGGTDPVGTDTFAISDYKVQIGDYCYITAGTGKGSWAIITAFTGANGTVTVADWLTEQGNPKGTDPTAGSTFAITQIETVGGDIARYPLPEYFSGDVNGKITYTKDSNHGMPIEWRDEAYIRRNRSVDVITSYPRFAAIRPLEHSALGFGPKRRFEIIFDPEPSTNETLEFPYTAHFNELQMESAAVTTFSSEVTTCSALAKLYPDDYFNGWVIRVSSGTGIGSYALVTDYTGLTGAFTVADFLAINGAAGGTDPAATSSIIVFPVNSLHPAGIRFDECIKAACLAEMEERIEDVSAGYGQKYQTALQVAHAIDMRAAPRKLGTMNRRLPGYGDGYHNRLDVTYENF